MTRAVACERFRGPSATDLREQIEYTYDEATAKKSLERILAFEGGTWVEKTRESFSYDTLGQLQTVTHADVDGQTRHPATSTIQKVACSKHATRITRRRTRATNTIRRAASQKWRKPS